MSTEKTLTLKFETVGFPPVGSYCLVELTDATLVGGGQPFKRFDTDTVIQQGKSDGGMVSWQHYYHHNIKSWTILPKEGL